ncbi:MAG TPA: hypothetical protein VEH04_12175 [Verrucomicrobiae bacterium]|nr:hypothetical protein [Verrucomicrobiae bacterium]
MRSIRILFLAFLAVHYGCGCLSHSAKETRLDTGANHIRVVPPPESFFEIVRDRDRDAARQFYGKHVNVSGIPVVASSVVADAALQRTHWLVTHLLAGRPDIAAAMVSNGMYLIIIGKDQVYTDMPEYRNNANPEYLNERVRGTGGKPTSFGEENLLCLPLDRYDDESIGLHEFCHTIDGALRAMDPAWNQRKNAAFREARDKGLWQNVYAGSSAGEYWAEICQAYFDCNRVNNWNHNHIGTREQLKEYDPAGYELVRSTFNLSGSNDWRYTFLQRQPSISAPPAQFAIEPYYTKFTWAREFPVVGRGASDEAMLRANDTIRKMFAYRHDILKALIAADLKLVVLGRRESLDDLPEFARLAGDARVAGDARGFDYVPEARLIVVGEENIVGERGGRLTNDCEVIRQFARALYFHTALRPVDPNWNNRGRNVQQYELRVKRLDEEFDARLRKIHGDAVAKGLWKGSRSERSAVDYWAGGVTAYFDAASNESRSPGAPSIATREALRNYDADLYELVHETMAYEGRQDWRYSPGRQSVSMR